MLWGFETRIILSFSVELSDCKVSQSYLICFLLMVHASLLVYRH